MGASFTSRVVAWVVFLSDVLAGQVVSSSLDVTVWVAINLHYRPPACTLRMWLMLNYECSLSGLVY